MDSKKFLLAIAACFLILVGYQWLDRTIYGPREQPKTEQPSQTSETPEDKTEPAKTPADTTAETAGPSQAVPSEGANAQELSRGQGFTAVIVEQPQPLQEDIYLLGSRDKGSGYKIEAKLTTDGASIAEAWLTEFADDSDEYKFSQSPYGAGRKTPVTLLSPVEGRFKPEKAQGDQPPCIYSLATSRLQLLKLNSGGDKPSREVLATIDLVKQKNWQLLENNHDDKKSWAIFRTVVALRQGDKTLAEVSLQKTYTLAKNSYDIEVKLELKLSEGSPQDLAVELIQDGPTGLGQEGSSTDIREGIYGLLNVRKGVERVAVTSIAYSKAAQGEGGAAVSEGDLLWAGAMNKFFGAFLVPESKFTSADDPTAPKVGEIFKQAQIIPIIDPTAGKNGNVLARLVAPAIELRPGQNKILNLKLFLGPKERDLLKSGQYGRLNFGGSIQYRSCATWCTFAWLSEALLWLLSQIYAVIPNYGVGIILLVILVRLALHHFTRMSQVSMMRMSKLGPELEKLKKKYGNNREEFSRAQMALYKENKINPVSGCLPMLLQMPIWIALYSGLNTAVELRHAPFFLWINNLSGADNITAYLAGGLPEKPLVTLPLLGAIWGLNILPILLGVAFFLQQKFTPSAGMAASPQAAQTKTMMYFMMGLFPLMLYGAPSGLNLYIMTSTFVGVIENHYIKEHIRKQEEIQNRPIVGDSSEKIKSFRLKKK